MRKLISVNIQIEGYWPTTVELLGRDAVTKELEARDTGEFLGAGSGMGSMDFAYEVEHAAFAQAKIGLVIEKHLPGHKYTIDATSLKTSQDFAVASGRRQGQERRQQPEQSQDNTSHRDFGLGM